MTSRALAALLLAALAGACDPANGADAPAPPPAAAVQANAHDAGRKIYNFRCYYCHGYSGDARTLASTFLEPRPRDFTALALAQARREAMLGAVRDGRAGTAMQSFASVLTPAEIEAVVDFVRTEFVLRKGANTRYHTAANGWPRHERYGAAFPFATGEIALDLPWQKLDATQAAGKRLYMSACVSCHDRGRVLEEGAAWELRAVSYPPNEDACTGCHTYSEALHGGAPPHGRRGEIPVAHGPYALHDTAPRLRNPSAEARRGERIFQRNCAFCHAADGSGKNWIGAFLEPHPRDLRDRSFMSQRTRGQLAAAIRDGLPDSSMPAWKSVLQEEEISALTAYLDAAFGPIRR